MATQGSLNPDATKPTLAPVVTLARNVEAPDTLQLSAALQTTLEVEQLLQIFSDAIQEQVPHAGLTYRNNEHHFVVSVGQRGRHHCSYRLNLLGDDLGEIALNRNKRFAEQELSLVEFFLCSLVYPLRNAMLYRQAMTAALRDPLTGIGNRAALEENLVREVSLAHRHQSPLSLIAVDLDNFKQVNDRHGHTVGDCVLRTVTRRMVEMLRSTDLAYRYGGEEFVILLSGTPLAGAELVAERIREAVASQPCHCENIELPITISLGVASLAEESSTALFDRADQALYRAKAHGRNRVELDHA